MLIAFSVMEFVNRVQRRRLFGALLVLSSFSIWAPARSARANADSAPVAQRLEGGASCTPREDCCKVCSKGKACGNTCIRADYNCHKGAGCACDEAAVCD